MPTIIGDSLLLLFLYGVLVPFLDPLIIGAPILFFILLISLYGRSIILPIVPIIFSLLNIILLLLGPEEYFLHSENPGILRSLVIFGFSFFAVTAFLFPIIAFLLSKYKENHPRIWYLAFYFLYFMLSLVMFSLENVIYFVPTV